MSDERSSGEAAWKADRDAIEERNASAKRAAREHETTHQVAVTERERRLDVIEAAQLRALNERLGR
jgi:hypothetical protein